jgi:asparagine N-glycosylation enzyme membrane subunit Stt3
MQTLTEGYRSMSLLLSINWDRLLYVGTIAVALYLGAVIGSFLH